METVYLKIIQTFKDNKTEFTDKGLLPLRQIDIYMGQPDDPESFEIFSPAMFIDWGIKPGTVETPDMLTLDCHVLQEPGAGTESFSDRIAEGLNYIKFLKVVKKHLNMLSADNTSPLKYAGERPAVTPYYRYHILSYTCSIDSYIESIHRPELVDSTVEKIIITEGMLRNHSDIPEAPEIEIYK